MRHRYLLGLNACVILLGGIRPAVAADAPVSDEQTLRQAGIAVDGPGLLTFFRQRTADVSDQTRIQTLVRQLGDDRFRVREQASKQLVTIGPRADSPCRRRSRTPTRRSPAAPANVCNTSARGRRRQR